MTMTDSPLAPVAAAPAPAVDKLLAMKMAEIGKNAKKALKTVAFARTEQKDKALLGMAKALRDAADRILAANATDVDAAKAAGLSDAMIDRLTLTPERVEAMARGLEEIAALPDPVGTVLATFERPNGLKIERVSTPLGVVGVIYESRPNVTADAAGLCLKAGNVVILRGGSDSAKSAAAIHMALTIGLENAGLPAHAVQLVNTTDRAAVGLMLGGLDGVIDVIVPRGGKSLVQRVQAEARVPVFAHLEGINHVYVDRAAKLDMAIDIVVNSKMRRTSVCGAAETLLVDRTMAEEFLVPLVRALQQAGCEVRGDPQVMKLVPDLVAATPEDFRTEHLDGVISVALVAGLEDAIDFINTNGSHHTDAIVTRDPATAARFLERVDSAIVLHNASTQFADGGEFGMGAEIGIATGKLHARGPIGVEQLTTFKYRVRGYGQVRP